MREYLCQINIVSGIRIDEPAVDLGIALALVSSYKNLPLPKDLIAIGEVGLTGEIRTVNSLEKRIKEADKMGFKTCLVSESSIKQIKFKGNINVIGVKNIRDAINVTLNNN